MPYNQTKPNEIKPNQTWYYITIGGKNNETKKKKKKLPLIKKKTKVKKWKYKRTMNVSL